MQLVTLLTIITISSLILNVNIVFSEQTEVSKIRLHKMRTSLVDGGQPLVFVGKLTNDVGEPIANATVFIKNNQNCPADQIVGIGITDEIGSFHVYTISEIWNEKNNLVKFNAEFNGNEKYLASVSNDLIYVIYPSHAQKCEI
jgi:hypothetical protein